MVSYRSLFAGFIAGISVFAIYFLLFPPPYVQSIFSPNNGNQIISELNKAEKSIDIEVYAFTSEEVISALENAHSRGVAVRVLLDPDISTNTVAFSMLLLKGIDVRWASRTYKSFHTKFIIIDGKLVIVGSHNLSNSALNYNREASVLVVDSDIVADFAREFALDWSTSSPSKYIS